MCGGACTCRTPGSRCCRRTCGWGGQLVLNDRIRYLPKDLDVGGPIIPTAHLAEVSRFGETLAPGSEVRLSLQGSRHACLATRLVLGDFPNLLRVLESDLTRDWIIHRSEDACTITGTPRMGHWDKFTQAIGGTVRPEPRHSIQDEDDG